MGTNSQSTNRILMVRPAHFSFNTEAAKSNAFQQKPAEDEQLAIISKAQAEFDGFVHKLKSNGVQVTVVEDTTYPIKPDAIFPNNWITMHADGTIVLYPMFVPNRRHEVRGDLVRHLQQELSVKSVIDLTFLEADNRFLEGTGSIIFDHQHKMAYACLSPRTEKALFEELCERTGYEPVTFYSLDQKGREIYHTNVMMCVGTGYAVICLESIPDLDERSLVVAKLAETGHELIAISYNQMNQFAGNMLEVKNEKGELLLVMSESAYNSLSEEQKKVIEKHATPLVVSIPTIERIGGGSARCMMAEIFLPEQKLKENFAL